MAVLTCGPSALFPGRGISPLRPPHSACLTSASGSCFPPAHAHPPPQLSIQLLGARQPTPGPNSRCDSPCLPGHPCLECSSPPHLSASPLTSALGLLPKHLVPHGAAGIPSLGNAPQEARLPWAWLHTPCLDQCLAYGGHLINVYQISHTSPNTYLVMLLSPDHALSS